MRSPADDRPHLSVTQVNTYRTCPMRYYFRYVEGLIVPPRGVLVRGKAVHRGVETNLAQKVETGEDLPVSDVEEATAAAFEEEAACAEFAPDEKPGKLKDEAVSLARLHTEEVAPTVRPAAVEQRVEFDVSGSLLIGYIDVLETTGAVRDTKALSRSPAADAADRSIQLSAYAYAVLEETGALPEAVVLDCLVASSTPKAVVLRSRRTEEDMARLERVVGGVARAIAAGVYYPNEDQWSCSPTWCGYWDVCMKETGRRMHASDR